VQSGFWLLDNYYIVCTCTLAKLLEDMQVCSENTKPFWREYTQRLTVSWNKVLPCRSDGHLHQDVASRKVEDHLWILKVLTSQGGKRHQGISPHCKQPTPRPSFCGWTLAMPAVGPPSALSRLFTSQLEMLLKLVHHF